MKPSADVQTSIVASYNSGKNGEDAEESEIMALLAHGTGGWENTLVGATLSNLDERWT